jgi:hypothetical protein
MTVVMITVGTVLVISAIRCALVWWVIKSDIPDRD